MKLHLPKLLRRLLLASLACAVTVADAEIMHAGVSLITYTDFGQNLGRFAVGDTNALLNYIREREGGVVITYVNPDVNAPYTMLHGMIDFSSQCDGGYGAAIGYNFYATVQHNGVHTNTYSGNYIGGNNAIVYQTIEYRDSSVFLLTPSNDYKIGRQSKIITDVTGSTVYGSDIHNWDDIQNGGLAGQLLYRTGSGTMKGSYLTGGSYDLAGAYTYIAGGIARITSTEWYNEADGAYSTMVHMNDFSLTGINNNYPMPFASLAGDSGSPAWIWNERTQQFEYLTALQSGDLVRFSQFRSAPKWTVETMESFNVNVDLSATTGEGAHGVIPEVHIGAVDTQGETVSDTAGHTMTKWIGHVYDSADHSEGHQIAEFVGIQSGINTWQDLSNLKDTANWYHYGNNKLNGSLTYQDLFFTNDLVFSAGAATTSIVADADVDLGIGYVRLSKGDQERARFNIGGEHLINSAGYVVDRGVDAYITLTNPDNYMYEWRAIVEEGATLHIEGTGDTNALLNVGRGGTTYLNRTGGYAAYNVLANNGSRVVISDLDQIKRDFTFGFRGGVLDMNGLSMTWNNDNGADAAGFTIHALDEQAEITNAKAGSTTTLTWTQGGDQTWLGSFVDEAGGGALKFIYDGGAGSSLTLRSIHTDLHHEGSGITVASGTVKLEGTNVIHGTGSLNGRNANRYFSNRDWHYVDMATPVEIQNGGTFELASHARLTGNVTINDGGTFIMREGVQKPYEYVEGGQTLEDTSIYRDFYGLKGDIINSGAVRIEFSAGTTSTNYYEGAISGSGSLTINTGSQGGSIVLSGANTSTGTRTVTEGIVILANEDAFGTGSIATGENAWKIGEKAWLAVEGVEQSTLTSHIHAASNGALALTQDTMDAVDMSGHTGLFLGAAQGLTVQYGEAGTSETLDAWHPTGEEGRLQWLLGGGGGEIVVNWKLTGDNDIVLGNPYMSGTVTLTNIENNFTGNIIFTEGGNVVLNYTNPRALGGSHVDLSYGKAMSGGVDVPSMLEGETITSTANGILLVDDSTGSDIDLTGHTALQLGANKAGVLFTGTISVERDGTYRLGGPGELRVQNALAANGRNNLVVDAQGFSGGVVALGSASAITGDVTVMGHDASLSDTTGITDGDITLALVVNDALAQAATVTAKDGGTIIVGAGSMQHFNSLSVQSGGEVGMGVNTALYTNTLDMGVGSSLYGVEPSTSAVQTGGGTIAGTVTVGAMVKTGSDTLTLASGHYVTVGTLDVREGSLALGVDSNISGTVLLHNGTNAITFNNHYLDTAIDVAAGETATFSGQNVNLKGNNMHLASGGTLDLTGVSRVNLQVASANNGQSFGGTVKTGATTLYSDSGRDNMSYTFANLDVHGATKLEQRHWNTLWNIESLTGSGSLTWNVASTHSITTTLTLSGEGDFTGTVAFRRQSTDGSRAFQTVVEVGHDRALQNATVELTGWGGAGFISMAINTDHAYMKGLNSNEASQTFAIIYAGAAFTAPQNTTPASTRNAVLELTGEDTYVFNSGVSGDATNAITLVKSGSGTQTFADGHANGAGVGNNTVSFRDVTVLGGTLNLNNTHVNVYGDYAIAQGATLNVNGGITLTEGHTLAALNTAGNTGSATLGSALTLAGGSLTFSGEGMQSLAANTYLLSLASVAKSEGQDALTVNFVDVSSLQEGSTYLLATGDFGALNLDYTAAGVDFLNATFQATASGLAVTFSAVDGAMIWNGTDSAHAWTTSVFSTKNIPGEFAAQDFYFTNTAANKNVAVGEALSGVKSMEISGTGYTFSGESVSTAGALTVRENASATFDNALTVNGALTLGENATGTFNGATTLADGMSLAGGATAEFANLTMTAGTATLADGSRLVVKRDGTATINLDNTSTGTLAVENGGTANLGNVTGTAQYRLEGAGTINLTSQGEPYILASTGNDFSGTLHVTLGNANFVVGANGTTESAFADNARPDLVLSGGSGGGFILNNYYAGTDSVLNIGSLSGDSANVNIRGNYNNNPSGVKYRYISVHQDGETSFAGKFNDNGDRSVGIIMNGAGEVGGGTLVLTSRSESAATLIINSGTVEIGRGGSGHWNGDILVNGGGQFFLELNTGINSGKTLTLVGNGVAEFTDAAGTFHEARRGALKLANGIELWQAVEVLNPGASVMTEAGVTASLWNSISGSGNMTKIGAGTLNLKGDSTATGDFYVEEGTLNLTFQNNVSSVRWSDDIIVENGANLTTSGEGTFNVDGNITRNFTAGTHTWEISALATGTASKINIGDGTTLNLLGGEFSGLVIAGAEVSNNGSDKGAVISGTSIVNVDGATVTGDIHGGSHVTISGVTKGLSTEATVLNLRSGSVATVYGGHRINGSGSTSLNTPVSLGSALVNLDGATVTGNIYGGSFVERNVGDNTISQGALVVDLNAGSLAGNVYAAGKQTGSTKLATESTEVRISNAVVFNGSDQIISGGYETSRNNSTITGTRTLTLTSEGAYSNLDGLAFKEFDVIDSSATSATLANFTNTGSLVKKGAGAVTLSQTQTLATTEVQAGTLAFSNGATFTGDVTVAEGAILSLSGAVSLASAIASSGTVDFSGVTFAIDQSAFVDGRYDIVTGTGTTTGTLTLDNFTGIGSNVRLLGVGGGSVYLLVGGAGVLTWNGTSTEGGDAWGGVNWRTDSGSVAFAAGSEVLFTGTAQNKSVNVNDAGVQVASMGVTAAGYEFSGGAVAVAGDLTMGGDASARFNNTLAVAGNVVLNAGSTLALSHDATLSVAADTTNTGTLEAGADATLNLGDVSGTARYKLAGEGTVRMNVTGGDYILASDGNTLSGALEINLGGRHFIAGSAVAGNVNFTGNPDISLSGGSGSSQFIINSNYHGTDHVLSIGALASASTSVEIHAANGANPANEDHRYLSVHQDTDTTFAGRFLNAGRKNANGTDGLRGAGLIMNGTGTLTLTGNNNSMADLIVSSGTVALSGNGYWKGDVTVEAGGQLHLQKNGALNSAQALRIAGAGVANPLTRSASLLREGALVLDNDVTLAHDVTIDDDGASVMTDTDATATISGAVTGGTLSKVGEGKLNLTGGVDLAGLEVEAGTLSLTGMVAVGSAIESHGSVEFNEVDITLNLTDVTTGNRYDIVTGDGATSGTFTLDNITINVNGVAQNGDMRLLGMGTSHVFVQVGAGDLVWNGTTGNGGDAWENDNWLMDGATASFLTGDTVYFTAVAANKNAVVGADGVDAGAMHVSAAGYTFTGGAITTTGDLVLGDNATAAFNNAGLAVGGDISLGAGSTLGFGFDISLANAITVGDGGAKLSVDADHNVDITGSVTGGELSIGGAGAVSVSDGGSLGGSGVTVESGAQLNLGKDDAIGADTTLTVAGTLKLEDGVTLDHPLNLGVPGGGTVLTDTGATGTISGTITGSPLVKAGQGTLILAGTQDSLQTVNLNEGTLVFDTDASVSPLTFGEGTTVKVGTGHTLTLPGVTRDNIATLFAHATADADHDGTVSLSLVKVDNQKLQGTHNISANYRFTGASGIEFNNWNAASAYDATLNVTENGSITVDNGNLAITSYVNMNIQGGEVTAPNVVVGAGEGNNNCAHLTLESGSLNTQSITLNCRSNNAATHSTNFVMTGGTLDLSGGTDDIFLVHSANSGTRGISLTGGTVKVDAARTVGVDLTMGGVEVVSTGEGSGITFAAGKTVTWTDLITNNGGNLTFNGTIDLVADALDAVGDGYYDALDPTSGSGYKATLKLVSNTNGGTVALGENAAVTVGGTAYTAMPLTVRDSGLYLGDSTIYYVNTGTDLQYGADTNSAASADTTGIVLNGGNMHMLQSLTSQVKASSGVDMQANATVHIGADATLDMANVTKNGHTLTIDGTGVFVNSPGVTMQASMASTWKGTVEISGISGQPLIVHNYGTGTGSTVRFNGVSGWFQVNNTTIAENIEFAAGNALNITGTSGKDYTFNGSVSGVGNMSLNTGNTNDNFIFNGDVSQWTGSLTHGNTAGNTVLKFTKAGDATIGMSAISHTGAGTLDVQVSGTGAKTIAGKLTNTTLTMNGTGTMGFTRQLAMDGGKLVVNSGTVTVDQHNGGTSQLKGTAVEVNGGGTIVIKHDAMGWDANTLSSILLQGESETNRAVMQSDSDATGNNAFGNTCSATLTLAGHALVESVGAQDKIRGWNNMTITATGTDNEISAGLRVDKAQTITVGDATHPDSELKISGQFINNTTLTKAGTGTLELTGADPTYGTWNLNAGTLKVTKSGSMSLSTGTAHAGTLEVAQGTTINLGETGGGAYYSLNGAGNVSLKSNGSMYILASTGNTLSGTLTVEIGNQHFLLGADANTTVNFAENARPDLVLVNNNAGNDKGFILNKNYAGIGNAFEIGSLSSDSVNADIRGDYHDNPAGTDYRFVSVHQDTDTTYAGTFHKTEGSDSVADRSVGLIMNGAGETGGGTLTLTGNSESLADLIVNGGTVAISGDNGHWSGNATVNAGGQLYLQKNAALDAAKTLTLAGTGVEAFTDAAGDDHEARVGALKLANDVTVGSAVTIASAGASVFVDADEAATLSGAISKAQNATTGTLTKVGAGTLNLTGAVDVPGMKVQDGTLSFGGGTVTLHGAVNSDGTVNFNGSTFAISADDFRNNRYDVVTGSGATTGTLSVDSFTVTGDTAPLRLAGMGSSNVYLYAGNTELTWDGTNATGGNAWGNENWTMDGANTSFMTGDTVNFTDTAENKAVAVTSGGVSAEAVNITSDGYSFTGGSITTTGDISVADGVSVSQSGGIKVGGDLDVGENATFTIAAGNVLDGSTLTKTGAGTLQLGSKLTAGAFDIQEGSLVLNSYDFQAISGINLQEDTKLVLNDRYTSIGAASGDPVTQISMADGAVIEMKNGAANTRVNAAITVDATDRAAVIRGVENGSGNLYLAGTISGDGTLNLASMSGDGVKNTNSWAVNSAVSDGTDATLALQITDVTVSIGGDAGNTYSGGTSITNSSVTVNKATAFGTGAVEMAGSDLTLASDLSVASIGGEAGNSITGGSHTLSLTADSGTATYAGTISGAALEKSGEGTQIISGAASLDSLNVTAGALTLSGGTTLAGAATVTGGALTLGGDVSLPSPIASSGTVAFDNAGFSLTADNFTDNRYNIVTGDGATSGTINLSVADSSAPVRVVGMGSGSVYAYLGNGELTWNGTTADGGDAWGNGNWLMDGATTSFATGDTVHFTAAAENKDVTVTTDGVTAGTMDITASGYTFSGGAISATNLTLGEGVTATFGDALTVANTVALNNGTLKFETDGTYTVAPDMTGPGNVEVSGTGAKTIGGKLTDVTLTMNGEDTLGFSRQLAMEGGKLVINSGEVTLNNHNGKTSQLKNTAVEVYGGGKLTIQHDSLGWKDNASDTTSLRSILLQGESETNRAVLSNDDSTGNNTFSAALNLSGHAAVESTDPQKTIKAWIGMSVTALDTDNEISAGLNIASDLNVTVGDATHAGSELEISGALSGGHALGKNGSGKLTLSGDNTSFTGNIKTVAGTLDITGNTNANMLYLQAGTTNISSTVTAAKLQMVDEGSGNSAVNIKNGGSVTLSSDADDALIIAGWSSNTQRYEGTLTVEEGGSLTAENAVMQVSYWDNTTGHVNVDGGSVNVKGISFHHKLEDGQHLNDNVRGSLTLSNGGELTIGSEGIKGVEKEGNTAKVNVTLGEGTIHSSADWTMGRFTDGATLVDVTLNGTEDGTTFDTDGHEVTIDNNLVGDGKLVKVGEGTLKLTGANTYTGSTTVEEGTLALADGSGSLANGYVTLSAAHSGADASIQSAMIEGNTISGLEGEGQVANLKVLLEDSKVTIRDMVISADSTIGYDPDSHAIVGTQTAAMNNSKLVLEQGAGKNASLSATPVKTTEVITRIDGEPDIAIGTAISYVDCTTFNVDVLSGSLTLDFSSMWDDIVAQHTKCVAVDFSGVDHFDAGNTTIHASANGWSPVEAISYGSAGGHVVYFEISQIPEPATATLSILALAGLLARRRRRH